MFCFKSQSYPTSTPINQQLPYFEIPRGGKVDFQYFEGGDDKKTVITSNTTKRSLNCSRLKTRRRNRYRISRNNVSAVKRTEGENPNCSQYFSNFMSPGGATVTPKCHTMAKSPLGKSNLRKLRKNQLFHIEPLGNSPPNIAMCNAATTTKLPLAIPKTHAFIDSGASSMFIMDGAPVTNIKTALDPVKVRAAQGAKIETTHTCDVNIAGLPTLPGHILPELAQAFLISVRVLCRAGCRVIFDDQECRVYFKGQVFQVGYKDPATNLWIMPISEEGGVNKRLPNNFGIKSQGSGVRAPHGRNFPFSKKPKIGHQLKLQWSKL